jgi:hypothetical protein
LGAAILVAKLVIERPDVTLRSAVTALLAVWLSKSFNRPFRGVEIMDTQHPNKIAHR